MQRVTPDLSPTKDAPSIRPASTADIPSLLAIEERSFLSDRLSARSFHHLLTRACADCLVASVGGRLIGYSATFYRQGARVARLHSLAVDPAAREGGAGRSLLKAAEAAAQRHGASLLRLAVRQDNHDAVRLYGGAGYRKTGEEPAYYADGMAAFTMEKNIASG